MRNSELLFENQKLMLLNSVSRENEEYADLLKIKTD